MQYLSLDKDILPVSEFRSSTAAYLKQIKKSKRPIILTQNGRSAAVVLDIGEYMKLSKASENVTENNEKSILKLCGSWKDNRSADEIVNDIYSARTSSDEKGIL